jgi:hypothetical protein
MVEVKMRRFAACCVLAGWLAAPCSAQGQAGGPSETGSFFGRLSVGARVSVLFNDLMNTESLTHSTSSPVLKTTTQTTSTSNQLGAGGALELALLDRLSLAAEVLYRKAGYKSSLEIVEGSDNPKTTRNFERTRADYWDLPLTLRLYDAPRQERRSRAFLDLGFAIRRVSNVRTFSEFLRPDNTSSQSEAPANPRHRSLPGVVLGGGFQLVTSAPVKVVPQIRLTRWLGSTFDAPPTQSRRNQFEFVLGIAF